MISNCLFAGLLILSSAAVANAQSAVPEPQPSRAARSGSPNKRETAAATSFAELAKLLKPGAAIRVTDARGRSVSGRLGQLSTASLELLGSDGSVRGGSVPARMFSEADVQSVEVKRRDSVVNGTLIGLVVGAVGGAASGAAICAGYSCDVAPVAAAYAGLLGGLGAGAGLLTDLAITGRTHVYRSNQRPKDVRVSPVLSKAAAGAIVSVRF